MSDPPQLILNEFQSKAYLNLKKFLADPSRDKFLLLGPAGSGKTTVIVNAFNGLSKRIVFTAFTNKATQVLSKIANKFAISFKSDFMTIHKLLCLEIKYLDRETEIAFTFDKEKIAHLKEYEIIIFDECSTISRELYKYICEAAEYIEFSYGVKLKMIFLGDFWQLPPVGEEKSVVFERATKEGWRVSKLDQVMRSANDGIRQINHTMIEWIPRFKTNDVDRFITGYPYNLVSKQYGRYLQLGDFLERFLSTWQTETADCVILTYSRNNCDKTNQSIQDLIDCEAGRPIPKARPIIRFYPGDRCCIDRPIDLFSIVRRKGKIRSDKPERDLSRFASLRHSQYSEDMSEMFLAELDERGEAPFEPRDKDEERGKAKDEERGETPFEPRDKAKDEERGETPFEPRDKDKDEERGETEDKDEDEDKVVKNNNPIVCLGESLGTTLYNGEIFDICDVEDVQAVTPLNKLEYLKPTFPAQILTIARISNPLDRYKILHIPEPYIEEARALIKSAERRMYYLQLMSDFIKKYPKLTYGYCLTIYKSQGSEWNTVFVNLNSIKWSIVGQGTSADIKKKAALFKSTYTAISRASDKIYCLWSR